MRATPLRRHLITAVAIAAGLVGAVAQTGAATASVAHMDNDDHHGHGPAHIFDIMMENHGFSQIVGNTADAPFINTLATKYNVAKNFHGVTHPSLPNYLAAVSGSNQGIWDDCPAGATSTCAPEEFIPGSGDGTDTAFLTDAQIASATKQPHLFAGKNIVDQLEAKGKSWKAYMQSMPSAGFTGVNAPVINGTTVKLYAQKHNPFVYFSDITSNSSRMQKIVPFENNFANDLASGNVPAYSWISPDQCHDMHGVSPSDAALIGAPTCGYPASGLDHGAIKLGDDYLQQTITTIMNSNTWKTSNSSIIIRWDENDYSGFSGGPGSPVGKNNVVLGGGDAPLIVINSDRDGHHDQNNDGDHDRDHDRDHGQNQGQNQQNQGQNQQGQDQDRGHHGQGDDKPKVNTSLTDHYSVLATIEKMWDLGCVGATCSASTSGNVSNLFDE